MSLGTAFVGFIFLFFIVFCMYFAWNGFFSSVWQKTTKQAGLLEESPEWRAFLDRRKEIESDPTLDESSKLALIENWQTMALESKPHMQNPGAVLSGNSSWIKPGFLPILITGSLLLAAIFSYSIGAMNEGALKWPGKNADLIKAPTVDQAIAASAGHPGDGASLEDRLAGLKVRLSQQPDDLRGWVLLARTHASMSNYSDSVLALKKALELTPGHPDILADLADMTAMAQGRKLAGEPEQYIAAALQSNPSHEKALALAASAAEQAGDNNKAQVYWQLLAQVQQNGLKNTQPENTELKAAPANILTSANVNVPQSDLNKMNDSSALFVFMKAQNGPGMPLAVVRVPGLQLKAGQQAVHFGPGDFIQEGVADKLPDVLHFQARLSVQGLAQTGAGDVESAWVAVPRSELGKGFSLNLGKGSNQ